MTITDTALPARSPPAARMELGGLGELLGFHLRLAQLAMYRDFVSAMETLDLTQKQLATLQLISANPGVSQVDLAATLGTDRATMMGMIDRLDQRGLLVRERSSSDRRRQELSLTGSGAELLIEAKRLLAGHEQDYTSRFSGAELESLMDALRRIHRQI
jgi:DNA-binding MarR family transcriptional regulator